MGSVVTVVFDCKARVETRGLKEYSNVIRKRCSSQAGLFVHVVGR